MSQIEHEIAKYEAHSFNFNDSNEEPVYDPMRFFQHNVENFPILTVLAKAIFCCSATSVPAESLFSQSGLIQNDLRNRLSPNVLEMLNFIKSNKFV